MSVIHTRCRYLCIYNLTSKLGYRNFYYIVQSVLFYGPFITLRADECKFQREFIILLSFVEVERLCKMWWTVYKGNDEVERISKVEQTTKPR